MAANTRPPIKFKVSNRARPRAGLLALGRPFHITAVLSALVLAAPQITSAQDSAKPGHATYLGVASCASSNCHGAANPRTGSNILQNEYTTWLKHDNHAQAWKVLLNSDSKKIGQHLGIAAPEKEPLCLKCHTTYVPNTKQQGEKFDLADGVSCESCHGAAGNWIKEHTVEGRTHAQNSADGLIDLHNLGERAKLCLSCHFGNEDKQVTHRLIGAGHPRLAFELDTFLQLEPKHWKIDDDYRQRKGEYDSAHSWVIGQLTAAKQYLLTLKSPERSRDGIWPELTLYNCYACHHSLTEEQWKVRQYHGRPGTVPLNTASLGMTTIALSVVEPKLAQRLKTLIAELLKEHQEGNSIGIINESLEIVGAALEIVNRSKTLPAGSAEALLKAVITAGTQDPHPQYETAEQLAMAISSILEGLPEKRGQLQRRVDRIYETLGNPKAFKPEPFIEALKGLQGAI